MARPSFNKIEEDTEKKYKRRDRKNRSKMKVSGAKVKDLQNLIINKK